MTSYSDKLRDERWQTRRNQILELDNHRCRKCLSRDNLQVHHKNYIAGAEPWQYADDFLITLCADCHSTEEYYKKMVKNRIDEMAFAGISYVDIYNLLTSV